jgi:hypothetical protein
MRAYYPAFDGVRIDKQEQSLEKGKVAAMASTADDRETGHSKATLVISVWHEAEHQQPFRARLTSTSGEASDAVISYAGSPEAVLSSVYQWLGTLPKS